MRFVCVKLAIAMGVFVPQPFVLTGVLCSVRSQAVV